MVVIVYEYLTVTKLISIQLTATEQFEIPAQPGGCVLQSQHYSPDNDFVALAGHTKERKKIGLKIS